MMFSLIRLKFRQRQARLLALLLFSFLLGGLFVFLYTTAPLATLRLYRVELSQVFTFLGYTGDSSLNQHLLGLSYGLALPLLVSLQASFAAGSLYARALDEGRMAQYTTGPHSRRAILTSLFAVAKVENLLLVLFHVAGQVVLSALLFPGSPILPLLRLGLGFLPIALVIPSLCLLLGMLTHSERGYRRLSLALLLFFLLMAMLARLPGWMAHLQLLSPWSLLSGMALMRGDGGFLQAAIALPISGILFLISLLIFDNMEL